MGRDASDTFVLVVLVLGNAAIVGAHLVARRAGAAGPAPRGVVGVRKLHLVDGRVWRGAAPTAEGYGSAAAHGVTTVVDLRAEHGAGPPAGLQLDRVSIPIRDGQTPTTADVGRFLDVVESAPGIVLLHCGAGVGRTGAMAGAYLVATGQARPGEAVWANLGVGPPSLEQIGFVLRRHGAVVVAASRVLDAPRRLWHVVTD
jgi:hypothetical protein